MLLKKKQIKKWIGEISFIFFLLWSLNIQAQVYSSGSTGADGAFAPTANTTLSLPTNGVFNFTTVNIPSGVTVTFTPNAVNTPVTILATGDITIAGTISVNGSNGLPVSSTGAVVNPGGAGGPGGYPGGSGGARSTTNNSPFDGIGPGGGICCYSTVYYTTMIFGVGGTYGGNASFVSLIPLFGGSGGSGGNSDSSYTGASGGGGGGAILISSSTTITVTGAITANGGIGGNNSVWYASGGGYYFYFNQGGSGSGGAIRLVAPQIAGTGSIQATGGVLNSGYDAGHLSGGPGLTRLEATTLSFSGSMNPPASTSVSLGPVTASSNPALTNLPSLTFSSIGTTPSPAAPTGSYSSADVSLPPGTTNPVSVNLAANYIPVGTVITVRLIPQFAASTSINTSPSTGTFSSSTASVPVTFPTGQISVLNAYASFTLPTQLAMLYPLIDGEPVDRVMVAANYGEASTVTFFTKSGKERKADQIFKSIQ
jgi:hypothetical protein